MGRAFRFFREQIEEAGLEERICVHTYDRNKNEKGNVMKYFGYVISLFLVLFLISEIAYAVSGEWLSTENEEESPIASYEERLDRSVPRLKGNAVLIWVLEDTEQETEEEKIREWMNLKPADYAGLDQSGFEQMLDERQPAPEMAELGLTEFEIRSFTGYEAVIAVKRRETETSRFGYWCQLQEDPCPFYRQRSTGAGTEIQARQSDSRDTSQTETGLLSGNV